MRSSDLINKAVNRVGENYNTCVEKIFGNATEFGGKAIPTAGAAIDSLIAGFLNAEISAMVLAIWAIESDFELFPDGDHGPAQLTGFWKKRKLELIVPGSYDPFPRRRGSPNRDLDFTGNPQANLMTLGNIVRWTHSLYGSWDQVAYWYGPGDEGAVSRPVYQEAAMKLFGKYTDFFRCLKKGPD